jgi:hypothetical protein
MSEQTSEPVIQRANEQPKSYDEALQEWEKTKRRASDQTDSQTNVSDAPKSAGFCYFFANLGLWGGMFVLLISLITQSSPAAVTALSGMASSLPFFAIAAHLRQQAVTNQLLGKIANKD